MRFPGLGPWYDLAGTLILCSMQRRDFLLAFGWMAMLGWCWAQATPEQLASLLIGQRVDRLPPETMADLRLLLTRLSGSSLQELQKWPEGEQAARRVLLHLLEGRSWAWVPFANPPAHPPALRADWGQPWMPK